MPTEQSQTRLTGPHFILHLSDRFIETKDEQISPPTHLRAILPIKYSNRKISKANFDSQVSNFPNLLPSLFCQEILQNIVRERSGPLSTNIRSRIRPNCNKTSRCCGVSIGTYSRSIFSTFGLHFLHVAGTKIRSVDLGVRSPTLQCLEQVH